MGESHHDAKAWMIVTLPVIALAALWATQAVADESFVRLTPLSKPKIVAAAQEFTGGSYPAENSARWPAV